MKPWNDWALISQSPLPPAVLALCALGVLAAFAFAANAYWRAGRRYWPLTLLQACSTFLVIALLLQPALDLRSVTHVPGRIAIVVDDSASMAQTDSVNESRFARVQGFLHAQQATLDAWREHHQIEFYSLAGSGLPTAPKGAETPLVAALDRPLETASPARPLAGVVLLSDGADTGALGQAAGDARAEEQLAALRKRKVPVSAIAVGSGKTLDLFIAGVAQDSIAFVRNTAKVEVSIGLRASEKTELSVPVTLLREGQVMQQLMATVKTGEPTSLTFDFVPDQVGEFVFSVAVPPQPQESVVENNQQQFIVKVMRDKIRALLVSGRPAWDERFLRRTLQSSPNVDLISFFILRTPSDLQLVPNEELSLIPFPTNELFGSELHTFDVVILQNFGYRPYNMAYLLDHLKEHVLNGGALVMLGGENSFGGGAYGQTPLADVLPVVMSDDAMDAREFTPVLTPAGEKHPVLRLSASPAPRAKVLERLPKFAGVNKVDGLVAGATALLVHPDLKGRDGKPLPVLAVREAGKGRTMALMTDSLWRWSFSDKMRGDTGGGYDRFVAQAMRWLMRDPEVSRLRLLASQEHAKVGENVDFTVRVLGADYQPLPGAVVTLSVKDSGDAPDTQSDADISGQSGADGTFTFPYAVKRGGVIRAVAKTELDGEPLETTLLVYGEESALERTALTPRPDLMSLIAHTLGGTAQNIDGAQLEKMRLSDAEAVTVDRHREVSLWRTWPALFALMATLSAEWLLRRRWGFA
jgi:uncharacterized membrane protein